jgi:IS605 OrfB family transposase
MKFRLYPAAEQEQLLLQHCSSARLIWNLALEQSNYYSRRLGSTPSFVAACRQLTELRQDSPWVAAGSQTVQQQALKDLDQAFKNWWSNPGHFGRPTWRSKGKHEGFRIVGPQAGRWQRLSRHRAQVNIPKVGWVDFRWSQNPEGAKSYRVKKDAAGRWWIAFAMVPAPLEGPGDGSSIGIDCGVSKPFVTSEGEMRQLPSLNDGEKTRLYKLQRKLARQQKGSEGRERTKRSMARLKHREINRRKDTIEKLTTQLAQNYDQILIEDLKIKNMTSSAKGTLTEPGRNVAQKTGLNRAILASGWGLFAQRLEDKASGRVVKVNPAYTSQTCNACQHVDRKNRESQAIFHCQNCGHSDNADINAAQNIRAAGQAVPASGGYRCSKPACETRTLIEPLLV